MRKSSILLLSFLVLSLLFVACSEESDDGSSETNEEAVSSVSEDDVDEGDEDGAETSADGASTEVAEEESSPSNVKDLFQKVAEVMNDVEGMALSGEIHSTTDMMGVTEKEVSDVSGQVSLNPLAQYLRMDAESDLDGEMNVEMYVTEDAMYMSDPESEGWFSVSMEQGGMMGDFSAVVTDSHMRMLSEWHELFVLTEDEDHYVVTFEGAGEEYKKIVYGGLKDALGEEAYHDLTDMMTEASGTYVMTIDKGSFYVVAMEMDSEKTMDMGFGEMHSTEQIRYEYSDFNEIEDVTVPSDVVENAKNFDMSGVMDGNE